MVAILSDENFKNNESINPTTNRARAIKKPTLLIPVNAPTNIPSARQIADKTIGR